MKKALVLLLALIMLVSAFAACTPPETPGNESKPAVDSKPSAPEETPDENNPEASSTEEVIGNLPDLDLGGSQYVILSRNDPWMVDEVSVEGTNGVQDIECTSFPYQTANNYSTVPEPFQFFCGNPPGLPCGT